MMRKGLLTSFFLLSLVSSAWAGHLRIERSPFEFVLSARKETGIALGVTAVDELVEPRLNGFLLAERMPSESVLMVMPDGKAIFVYSDLFLRHYRGRKQVLNGRDPHGRPAEDFLRFPEGATPPKFLRDVWRINARLLCMNSKEDILWWTGEIIYRFDFSFPVLSLRLESPDGRKTTVGDWEWKRVGRAVKIYASTDGRNWTLIWRSHGKGGITSVDAEIPPEMRGARTVYLKFWGQNANVLFDLFVTAELEAKRVLSLLRLKQGRNKFVFEDAPTSSHKAVVFWEGRGVRLLTKRWRVAYPKRKVEVAVRKEEIAILFPERVGIWLYARGGIVKGIKRLTVGEREVLAPLLDGEERVTPVASVIVGGRIEPVKDWIAYLKERMEKFGKKGDFPSRGGLTIEQVPIQGEFAGWHKDGDWVCVSVKLTKGTAEWLFAPATEELGGGVYKGIRWRLRLKGVGRVFEVVVEEPVSFIVGDWRLQQVWGPFEEHRLGLWGEFHLAERGYFARQQPFFFLAGEEGAVVGFFGEVVHAMVEERKEVDRVVVRSRIPVRAGEVVETPEKFWLFREGDFSLKWEALNEWTWVYDSVTERFRAMKGIRPVEPKPTLLWQAGWNPKLWGRDYYAAAKAGLPQKERWFYRLAKEMPKLARWGIRVIYVSGALESDADHRRDEFLPGSLCFGSICAPWRLEVSPCMGGEEGLRHLCQEAHRYGIKIVLWATPAHLSNSSPLLLQHPEWLAWRRDGKPEHFGYRDITGVSLRKGYFDYALRQYKKIHEATGFDGLWQDSFLTFGILTDFSEPAPYPQLDETIEMQRRLQEIGCTEIHIEGCGPFGLSSGGYGYGRPQIFHRIKGREYGLYYYIADTALEVESYFRALASKGIVGVRSILEFEQLPQEAREQIVKFNLAYLKVLPHMKRRRLIGEGEERWKGVEWLDERGRPRVLFAFEPIKWKVRRGAKVVELIEGRRFRAETGLVEAERWHIYLVEQG